MGIYIYIVGKWGPFSYSPFPWILIMFIYLSCGLGQHLIREKHGKPVALFGDKWKFQMYGPGCTELLYQLLRLKEPTENGTVNTSSRNSNKIMRLQFGHFVESPQKESFQKDKSSCKPKWLVVPPECWDYPFKPANQRIIISKNRSHKTYLINRYIYIHIYIYI